MKHLKRIGYVSVELVITAALIMAVGFFVLLNFGTTGSQLMQSGMDKLDALGLFGGGVNPPSGSELVVEYDENGYWKDLNVNPGDINPVSDFTFELNLEGDGYILVAYNSTTDFDVVVPKTYEGLPVMSIGEDAFDSWNIASPLTSVILPNSIKEILAYAFSGNEFSNIVIPSSVEVLDRRAFRDGALERVTFLGAVPSNLGTSIFTYNDELMNARTILVLDEYLNEYKSYAYEFDVPENAFFSWKALVTIPAPFVPGMYDSSLGITKDDINQINDFEWVWNEALNGWTIADYYNKNDLDVVIPSHKDDGGMPVVELGEWALASKGLTSVIIPNTVISISMGALYDNALTSFTIPDGVTEVTYASFARNQLSEVRISNNATIIADEAFSNNPLQEVSIPDSVITIGMRSFASNELVSVQLGSGLSSIGVDAFYDNELVSVTIPSNVKEIGPGAFHTNKIVSLVIEDGVEIIQNAAFSTNQIATLVIPDSVVHIGNQAFTQNQISSLTIPETNVVIEDMAFNNNKLPEAQAFIYSTGLDTTTLVSYGGASKDVVIPNNITDIYYNAFWSTGINSVNIPITVTKIWPGAFGHNNLTTVTLPENLVSIGDSAFTSNLLTHVEIPASVTTIGSAAFAMPSLSSVKFTGARPSVNQYAFASASLANNSVQVPNVHLDDYRNNATSMGLTYLKFIGY